MTLTGEAVMSKDMFKAVVRRLGNRWLVLSVQIMGYAILLCGVSSTVFDLARDKFSVGGLLCSLAMGGMLAFFIPWRLTWIPMKQAARVIDVLWRYEIGDEGVSVTTPMGTIILPWRNLTKVEDLPDMLLIHSVDKNQYSIVLKSAFSESDRQQLRPFIESKIAAARVTPGP